MGDIISTPIDSFTSNGTNKQTSRLSRDPMERPLAITRILDMHAVWLDSTIDKDNNRDCQKNIAELRRVVINISTFTDVGECMTFLSKTKYKNLCMIISGSFGEETVPQVHGMSKIDSIFIFCRNTTWHEGWAKDWAKIRGVFNNILSICEGIRVAAQQCDQDAMSMSFMSTSTDGAATNENLDKLNPSFMYTQIAKEILLTIEFKDQHFNEFIVFCREKMVRDGIELRYIDNLQSGYRDRKPIW